VPSSKSSGVECALWDVSVLGGQCHGDGGIDTHDDEAYQLPLAPWHPGTLAPWHPGILLDTPPFGA